MKTIPFFQQCVEKGDGLCAEAQAKKSFDFSKFYLVFSRRLYYNKKIYSNPSVFA